MSAALIRKRGRPSIMTDEMIEELVFRLAEGEPLRSICRDEHMPHYSTAYDWAKKNSEINQRIAHARECGWDAIAEDCLIIADTPTGRQDDVQQRKLQIWARLQLLSKWSGKYADNGTNINIANTVVHNEMTAEDRDIEDAKQIAFALHLALQKSKQNDGV